MPVAASSSFGAADLLSPPPRHADIQQQHSDSERDPAALAAAAARQLLVVDSKISEQQARHMVECNMLRALSCDLEQQEEALRKRATEAAEAADRVSSVDQSETQVKADLFEDSLADWFEEQGIRLRRQPEMVKEQSELLGRPVRTPDLLFLDHVYINDQPVAWIDAKHFYGADVEFQRKKMKKQMIFTNIRSLGP